MCAPPDEYQIPGIDNYLAFNIAFVLSMLIWELWLIIRLFYGASQISKLAFKPFKWACAGLAVFGVTMIPLRIYSREVFYMVENCPEQYVESWPGLIVGDSYYMSLNFFQLGFVISIFFE